MLIMPLIIAAVSFRAVRQIVNFSTLVRLHILFSLLLLVGFYVYVLLSKDLGSHEAQVITALLAGGINTLSMQLGVRSTN